MRDQQQQRLREQAAQQRQREQQVREQHLREQRQREQDLRQQAAQQRRREQAARQAAQHRDVDEQSVQLRVGPSSSAHALSTHALHGQCGCLHLGNTGVDPRLVLCDADNFCTPVVWLHETESCHRGSAARQKRCTDLSTAEGVLHGAGR